MPTSRRPFRARIHGVADLRPHSLRPLRPVDIDLLTGLHQPQAHFPCRLILLGILRVSDRREHEMGADRDVARLEHLLGFLAGELDVLFHVTPKRGADVHQLGAVLGVLLLPVPEHIQTFQRLSR